LYRIRCRQPLIRAWHQNSMQLLKRHFLSLIALALLFADISACSNKDNPDEIRQRTAEATGTMRRDTKAVVEGVKEGMAVDKTVNINKASREDLLSLPGITEREADRIISGRPFADTHELVTRHVLSGAEYDKIRDRVIAGR
jgi:DNA uptake protein ComE-like DNA-binding protein